MKIQKGFYMHYLNEALFKAIHAKNLDDVKILASKIKNTPGYSFICESDVVKGSLLHAAIISENPDIMAVIWVCVRHTPQVVFHTEWEGKSILHYLTLMQNTGFLAEVLYSIKDKHELIEFINLFDKDGFTALHYALAAEPNNLPLIFLLLQNGADFCLSKAEEDNCDAILSQTARDNNLQYSRPNIAEKNSYTYPKTYCRTAVFRSLINEIDDYLDNFFKKPITTPIGNSIYYLAWVLALVSAQQLYDGKLFNTFTLGVLDFVLLLGSQGVKEAEVAEGRKVKVNEYKDLLERIKYHIELPLEHGIPLPTTYRLIRMRITSIINTLSTAWLNEQQMLQLMNTLKEDLVELTFAGTKAVSLSIFNIDKKATQEDVPASRLCA